MFSKSEYAKRKVNFLEESHLGIDSNLYFLIYKTHQVKKTIKYDWEHPDFDPSQDKFMQRFDENGNFVNLPVELNRESPIYEAYF
jgi:hypothetical protein